MTGRRTLAERQRLRQVYLDQAIADARTKGLTIRCREANRIGAGPDQHSLCAGESTSGAGCLCTCHDGGTL